MAWSNPAAHQRRRTHPVQHAEGHSKPTADDARCRSASQGPRLGCGCAARDCDDHRQTASSRVFATTTRGQSTRPTTATVCSVPARCEQGSFGAPAEWALGALRGPAPCTRNERLCVERADLRLRRRASSDPARGDLPVWWRSGLGPRRHWAVTTSPSTRSAAQRKPRGLFRGQSRRRRQ